MATQLQRQMGIAAGKEAVPKGSEPKMPKKEKGSKPGVKDDPYPGLPKRGIGR